MSGIDVYARYLGSRPTVILLACAGLLPTFTAFGSEPEFAGLQLTEVTGSVSIRGLRDGNSTRLGGATAPESEQIESRQAIQLSVNTRSFVYHPNFMTLDANVGVVGQHSRFRFGAPGSASDTQATRGLYDLSLWARFLRDKPLNGSIYYEHLNPTISVGPALVMQQESTRHGLQVGWLEPWTPVPVNLEVDRQHSQGRGSGRLQDDKTDRWSLTADRAWSRKGSSRLRMDGVRMDSASGSTDLPITRTASSSLAAGLDTRLLLGSEDRYRLSSQINYGNLRYERGQDTPSDRKDLRGFVDLHATHSASQQSRARWDASNSDQGALYSRLRAVSAGSTWWRDKSWSVSLDGRSEELQSVDFDQSTRSISASTDYQWVVAGGKAQVGYASQLTRRSQTALQALTQVFGERHLMSGLGVVAVDRPNVDVATVRVVNETRTQVFIEGRDYLLITVGSQVRLQRIVTGDILDGQTVLLDYEFATGGSYGTRQLDQSVNLFWAWSSRSSLYARWLDSSPRLVSGEPTLALNVVRGRTVGVQTEQPLGALWSVGGTLEHENRRETILPLKRLSADAFILWEEAFIGSGGIRIGLRRQKVDYEQSLQDVDLTGWDLRYRVYAIQDVDIQADWSAEKDDGAEVVRKTELASLRARWRMRQLTMTLSVSRALEQQGQFQTRRTVGQWLLKRDF
jgi:hypothetical protein